MTALPRRALLAIAAVLDVALLARANPLAAKDLAARHALPQRQFEPLLQDLVRAGILRSARGPRGGYRLARERRRITLGDVARALQLTREARPAAPGSALISRVIGPAVAASGDALLAELDRVTIEDLCRRADGLAEGEPRDLADFAI